jgi:hypothetical protein
MVATRRFARALGHPGYIRRISGPSLRAVPATLLALALSVFGLSLAPAGSASAAATVTIVAGPDSPTVTASGTVRVSVLITNPTSKPLSPGSVVLASSTGPLLAPSDLSSWMSGQGYRSQDLAQSSVPAVAAGSSQAATIVLPASKLPALTVWGTRGLAVSYRSGDKSVASARTSVVLLAGRAPAPISVASVVPLVGPASTLGLMTQDELADATGDSGYLTLALAGAKESSASVAVDPRIVVSILTLGAGAPASATAWLKTLNDSALPGFWLGFGDNDTSGLIQAGSKTVVSPAIDDLPNIPEPPAGESWGGTNWPGWTPSIASVAWPFANSLTSPAAQTIVASGASKLLVSSGNLKNPSGAAGVSLASTPTVIVDDAVSGCVGTVTAATTSTASNAGTACVASQLAAIATAHPSGSSVLASLPRTLPQPLSLSAFSSALSGLTTLGFTRSTSLAALFGASLAPSELADKPESSARVRALRTLLANQQKIVAFSPVATEPSAVINPGDRRTAAAASSAWLANSGWPVAVATNSSMTDDVLNSVSIVTSSTINMVGGQAKIPVVIRNDLPSSVDVVVHAVPSNARITVAETVPLTLVANAQGRAYIPVTARVGSGRVDLEVTITTPAGVVVGHSALLPVNVRADWEGWGLLGIAVVFVALVIAGVIRTVRRRRRVTPNE